MIGEEELVTTYRGSAPGCRATPPRPCPGLTWPPARSGRGCRTRWGRLAGRYLDELPYHAWVLCGDSETAEGSIWEALDKASYYQLGNLTAIVDVNRLGQRGPTELNGTSTSTARVAAFGARHGDRRPRHHPIDLALGAGAGGPAGRPWSSPGRSRERVPELENNKGWHGKALPPDMASPRSPRSAARDNLRDNRSPEPRAPRQRPAPGASPCRVRGRREGGDPQGLRRRAGGARRPPPGGGARRGGRQLHPRRGVRQDVPGSVLRDVHRRAAAGRGGGRPGGARLRAVRLHVRGVLPAAYDFIRMAGISEANIRLVGSHAGVEIGADGPSQMALEDLAALRAVHGSAVLYPGDATATAALTAEMAARRASSTCAPPAAPTRSSTRPARRSRSAGPRCCAPVGRRPGHADRRRRHAARGLRPPTSWPPAGSRPG